MRRYDAMVSNDVQFYFSNLCDKMQNEVDEVVRQIGHH